MDDQTGADVLHSEPEYERPAHSAPTSLAEGSDQQQTATTARPTTSADDGVEHLRRLSEGKPAPRGQRNQPVDAALSWRGKQTPSLQALTSPLRVLVLFAGPCEATSHLPKHLRAAGCVVDAIDTKLGGAAHDVLREGVGSSILTRIKAAEYDAVFIR